jgi:hypothetical protein
MNRFAFVRFLACLACAGAHYCTLAADVIPAPDNWRKETFTFPLEFAPALKYQGVENVRFAPQWKEFANERGFSYVFMWDVKSTPMSAPKLERDMNAYFDGLMNRVADSSKLVRRGGPTKATFNEATPASGWTKGYAGVLRTWNAFSAGEALVLEIEIAERACGKARMQVFFMLSKAGPTNAIWDTMRAARGGTVCAL